MLTLLALNIEKLKKKNSPQIFQSDWTAVKGTVMQNI